MKKKTGIFGKTAALIAATLLCLCCLFLFGCGEHTAYDVRVLRSDGAETNRPLAEVLARIRPSVVDISAYASESTSAGSGVIVGAADTDGDGADDEYSVITNHHVVDGCVRFSVNVLFIAGDGTETHKTYDADLIGGSPKRDIAVLRIRTENEALTVAEFANSDSVRVGTDVVAIGNPLGLLGGTVTKGIVSATAREVQVSDIGVMTLMQTDTAINSGNSGGGLFDTDGRIVGIVNSGYDSYNGHAVEGLNFAIPANDALSTFTALLETYEETDGGAISYGYVAGDTELELAIASGELYDSSAATSHSTYVLAQASSTAGPFYADWGANVQVVTGVSLNGNVTAVSTLSDLTAVLSRTSAGDELTVTTKRREVGGFGMNRYYYVGTTETSVTVTAAQYVYNPPTNR